MDNKKINTINYFYGVFCIKNINANSKLLTYTDSKILGDESYRKYSADIIK